MSKIEDILKTEIRSALENDPFHIEIGNKLQKNNKESQQQIYSIDEQGYLGSKDRLYVPKVGNIRYHILTEFHKKHYSGHSDYQNMVTTVKKHYFFHKMIFDIADFIAKCLECQQIKTKHQHPVGLLQPFPILMWKWEVFNMDL